jgi:hypothetical protein
MHEKCTPRLTRKPLYEIISFREKFIRQGVRMKSAHARCLEDIRGYNIHTLEMTADGITRYCDAPRITLCIALMASIDSAMLE